MNIGQSFKGILAAVLLFGAASVAQANIIYNVNRTVGAGSVTGFLETDGTIGALSSGNFVNWSITIQAPNINGGVATTGTTGSLSALNGMTATATDLLFDFGSLTNFVIWNNASSDWWCLAGSNSGCFVANAETIGYADSAFDRAQEASYSGVQIIASAVPVPGTLALMLLALGLMAARRRTA